MELSLQISPIPVDGRLYPGLKSPFRCVSEFVPRLADIRVRVLDIPDPFRAEDRLDPVFPEKAAQLIENIDQILSAAVRDIINIAIEAVDPQRKLSAVMVGDRKHDISGAQDAGIDSVGITWGYGSRAELEDAGATWIVDTPGELCSLILE